MSLLKKCLVRPGTKVSLAEYDPEDALGCENKAEALSHLAENVTRLESLQEVLWAQKKHALLVILQAMDAGGKDGVIRHVMAGMNPQGCQVTSFKAPTA